VNLGKGAAVRTGMLAAIGDPIVFLDADGSTPASELPKLLRALEQAEIAIGSRGLDAHLIRQHQSALRENMGKTFNHLARLLVPIGEIRDSQCGFKAFRRSCARTIFARQRLDGFSFDVEVLWIARQLDYRIVEVPVEWSHRAGSKVMLVGSSLHMLLELVSLRLSILRQSATTVRPP
jgi:dolichyl-phosphate beta-glucosyltransferase